MALTKIKTGGIADNAITNAKMADDAIDSPDLADGSIDNVHLAGSIAVSKTLLSAGTGLTLSTNSLAVDAAQTQITSVGTLTSFRSTGIDDNADALAMTITSDENIGIGTTSVTAPHDFNSSGMKALEIRATDDTGDAGVFIRRSSGDVGLDLWTDSSSGKSYIDNRWEAQLHLRTGTRADGGERTVMTLRDSGNVGIGTEAPASTQGYTGILEIANASDTALILHSEVGGTANKWEIGNNTSGALQFAHSIAGDGSTGVKMAIDASGNVGVGTSSPGRKFVVYDDAAYIALQSSHSGTGGGDGFQIQKDTSNNAYLWNYESGSIQLATSGVSRMRIHSGGAVTFGGDSTLDFTPGVVVNGTTPALGIEADTEHFLTMTTTSGSPVDFYFDHESSMRFRTATNAGGTSPSNIMTLDADGDVTVSSKLSVGATATEGQLYVGGTIAHGDAGYDDQVTTSHTTYTEGGAGHIRIVSQANGSTSDSSTCKITWAKPGWAAFSYMWQISAASQAYCRIGGGYHNNSGATISGHDANQLYGTGEYAYSTEGSGQTIIFVMTFTAGTHQCSSFSLSCGGGSTPRAEDFTVTWVT